MGTEAGHRAFVEDEDDVGRLHRDDALRDEENRGSPAAAPQRLADAEFGDRVHGARAVVEDEDRGFPYEGARDGEALPLPSRQRQAAAADEAVVAVGKLPDEVVGAGRPGGFLGLVQRGVGLAPAQVLEDRAREEEGALGHQGHASAQAAELPVADIAPLHEDPAFGRVVETRHEPDEAALAGARGTDDSDHGPRRAGEAHAAEGGLAGPLVGEANPLELDGPASTVRGLPGARDAGRAVRGWGRRIASGRSYRVWARSRPRRLRPSREDLPDALGRGPRADEHVEDHRQHHEGAEYLRHVVDEGHDLAEAHAARGHANVAEPEDRTDAEVEGERHEGREDRHDPHGLGHGSGEVLVRLGEARFLVVEAAKGLDHADTREVLAHDAVHAVEGGLDAPVEGVARPEALRDEPDHDGHGGHEDEGHLRVEEDGHDDAAYREEGRLHHDPHEAVREDLDLVHVVREPRHERGRVETAERTEGEAHDPAVEIGAERGAEILGDPARDDVAGCGREGAEGGDEEHEAAEPEHKAEVPGRDTLVDHARHDGRLEEVAGRLEGEEEDGRKEGLRVPADVGPEIGEAPLAGDLRLGRLRRCHRPRV